MSTATCALRFAVTLCGHALRLQYALRLRFAAKKPRVLKTSACAGRAYDQVDSKHYISASSGPVRSTETE